ncbi:hypothetical protein [Mucilaginibacter aquariorum]|uniref:Uncharacterized protein n=1 Tax=Mucilaginibacter aquariorum TaxID=2967225 RepID=A0ABT1T8Y5_9SPHI|nr:hypothetical protein [Mucilaginibacter aquariorum]MCQ6961074.1 hypothetical protein [Mucilaginibacter aquariorum]
MKNKKPLSEHQKGRLVVAMEALQNPIFSTQSLNIPGVLLFTNTPGTGSAYGVYNDIFNFLQSSCISWLILISTILA